MHLVVQGVNIQSVDTGSQSAQQYTLVDVGAAFQHSITKLIPNKNNKNIINFTSRGGTDIGETSRTSCS